ncbi:MAG: hypothetical protein JO110_23410 [Acetobacteraceae bacterium]|nr:hypothetical protein [Acetobacteraceae bacterium]
MLLSYAFPRGVQMRFKSRQVPAYPLRIFALGWFAFSLAILAIDTLVIAFHPFGKWEFVAVIGAPLANPEIALQRSMSRVDAAMATLGGMSVSGRPVGK